MVRTMTLLFRRWLSHFQEHFVTFAMFWSNLRQTLVSACSVFLLKLSLKKHQSRWVVILLHTRSTSQYHFVMPGCIFPSTTLSPRERKSSEYCSSLLGQHINHGNRTRAACIAIGSQALRHSYFL